MLLLLACTICKEPAQAGSMTAVVGEEERLRAAGEDQALQAGECLALCEGYARALQTVDTCTLELLPEDEAFDTQGLGQGPNYLLTCAGFFYCR